MTSVAQKWLDRAGINLDSFQRDVERDLRPRSRLIPGGPVSGNVSVTDTWADAHNLAA